MASLQERRDARAEALVAEGNAIRAAGDDFVAIEKAAAKWEEAYDVRRGHADEPEWLED